MTDTKDEELEKEVHFTNGYRLGVKAERNRIYHELIDCCFEDRPMKGLVGTNEIKRICKQGD